MASTTARWFSTTLAIDKKAQLALASILALTLHLGYEVSTARKRTEYYFQHTYRIRSEKEENVYLRPGHRPHYRDAVAGRCDRMMKTKHPAKEKDE
jgi:hypothetical protein